MNELQTITNMFSISRLSLLALFSFLAGVGELNIEELIGVPGTDLFVGDGVGEADTLDLGPSVSRRTGATAEARGRVDATYPHVTGLHSALSTKMVQEHIESGAV